MLVIISDLHLNDGSAAPVNISPKAFAIWMREVLTLAKQNRAQELLFLYLGDMMDLLRTEHWFYPKPGEALGAQQTECFPLEDRPWGDRDINQHPDKISAACRVRALAILNKIRHETSAQLSYLSGESADIKHELEALGIPVRRYYIPGNHDRLFWVDPDVRAGVLSALAARVPDGPRPFEIVLPAYGVVARHGHEWDPWNFENCDKKARPADIKADDFKLVAIGDPITTEIVTRLPYQVAAALPVGIGIDVHRRVYEQLCHIEDVRPLSQALRWVLTEPAKLATRYDQATQDAILGTLNVEVKRIVDHFVHIPFVEAWLHKHDRWGLGWDEADILQDIHRVTQRMDIRRIDTLLHAAERLGLTKEHDDSEPAIREVGDAQGARFCIYGHSHTFRYVPLSQNAKREELVYLNSGTWRPRVAAAKDRQSFAGYKEMTYLVFYRADEDLGARESKSLSYEIWNGIMRK
jgi:UDP-2,3-diacylglucosamine pyrophosphatase LpxH